MRIPSALRAAGAAIACALVSTDAFALTQDVNLSATVAASCTLNGSDTPAAISQEVPVTAGLVSTTPIVITIPIACNTGIEFYMKSENLGLKGPHSLTGLATTIHYTASVTAPTFINTTYDTELMTEGQSAGGWSSSGEPNGNIILTITPKQPSLQLKNGSYSDTFRLTILTPQ